jgi:hypothetical protein
MLGDVVCSTPQCTTGEAQVQEMDATFQGAPSNVQAQFQSAHDSIMTSFNQIYGMLTNYIPFNPDCCTIGDLGNQAQALQNQMLSAMGQSGTPLTPSAGLPLGTLLILVGAGYLLLVTWAKK